jgi:hypothetical protein
MSLPRAAEDLGLAGVLVFRFRVDLGDDATGAAIVPPPKVEPAAVPTVSPTYTVTDREIPRPPGTADHVCGWRLREEDIPCPRVVGHADGLPALAAHARPHQVGNTRTGRWEMWAPVPASRTVALAWRPAVAANGMSG